MPCYQYGSREADMEMSAREYRRQVDDLTRMLCGLCDKSPASMIGSVPGLAEWWMDHQRRDAERKRAEAEKRDKKLLRARRERAQYERLKAKFE